MRQYDLAVIGGGFAGVGAALAAAAQGLRTIIVERGNCFGGAAVTALVNPFMPFSTATGTDPAGNKVWKKLSDGIFGQIYTGLREMGALHDNQITFDEEALKLLLNRMLTKANVDILFHSYLVGAAINNNVVENVTVANKSGNMVLAADYFVDATGDADLAALCKCPFRLGRAKDNLCQPMTLCFRLANVNMDAYKKSAPTITPLYQKLQQEGKIKNIREDVLIFSSLTEGVLHFNSTRVVKKNPIDAYDITAAEIEAREQVFELHAFLKEHIDGFEASKLIMTAPQIGVRESRKIDGEYVLTEQDLVNCVKFDDAIAAGNYDIDIHNPEGSGTSHYYFPDGEYYTIPYRSLIPKGVNNLLVAGRCISATHEAQASIRIMPIVCCLGEAAGTAVAVAHQASVPVNRVDVTRIQDILKANGAFIG